MMQPECNCLHVITEAASDSKGHPVQTAMQGLRSHADCYHMQPQGSHRPTFSPVKASDIHKEGIHNTHTQTHTHTHQQTHTHTHAHAHTHSLSLYAMECYNRSICTQEQSKQVTHKKNEYTTHTLYARECYNRSIGTHERSREDTDRAHRRVFPPT